MDKQTVYAWLKENRWLVTLDEKTKYNGAQETSYLDALSPVGLSVTFYFDSKEKLLHYNNNVGVTQP